MPSRELFCSPPKIVSVHGKLKRKKIKFARKSVEYTIEWENNGVCWTTVITKQRLNSLWQETRKQLNTAVGNTTISNSMSTVFSCNLNTSIETETTCIIQNYCNELLKSPEMLNHPRVLQLLEVSATSFDKQGRYTSIKEGYFHVRSCLRESKRLNPLHRKKLLWNHVTMKVYLHRRKLQLDFRRRWVVLKDSYLSIYNSPHDSTPVGVFLFDDQFTSERNLVCLAPSKSLIVSNHSYLLQLMADSHQQVSLWNDLLEDAVRQSEFNRLHRDHSFAPIRYSDPLTCKAKWFVDGHDTFEAIHKAITHAKEQIFITDWWLSPEIYLLRPPSMHPEAQLMTLLQKKAEEGIKIYILIYKEVKPVLKLNSSHAKKVLKNLHKNIYVKRDPDFIIQQFGFWSHHEKLVIVDQNLAFIGGFDLAFGKYDTHKHILTDEKQPYLFPGKDFSNERIKGTSNVTKPNEDQLDRHCTVRLPWHDVHSCLVGLPAKDIARHFVQRWNYAIAKRKRKNIKPPLLVPSSNVPENKRKLHGNCIYIKKNNTNSSNPMPTCGYAALPGAREMKPSHVTSTVVVAPPNKPQEEEELFSFFSCNCQVLRSVSNWSAGCTTEKSIQEAYLRLISEAKQLIYIENQFFVSGLNGDPLVSNRIADALVKRIRRAAVKGETFRVIIFLPLFPGEAGRPDELDATSLRGVMHWQYRTICRGEHSIYGRLFTELENPFDYIAFYGLRTHDVNSSNVPVSELIYIHSKTMIIDDCKIIIGSANINERSMSGNRDSEMAVVIEDVEFVPGTLNGEKVPVGKFSHSFRMKLFEEHFGAVPGTVRYSDLEDPVLEKTWIEMQEQAIKNTRIYESVFGCIPNDNVLEFSDLDKHPDELHEQRKREFNQEYSSKQDHELGLALENPQELTQADKPRKNPHKERKSLRERKDLKAQRELGNTSNLQTQDTILRKREQLVDLRGHVVCFPLQFLSKENLSPDLIPSVLFN